MDRIDHAVYVRLATLVDEVISFAVGLQEDATNLSAAAEAHGDLGVFMNSHLKNSSTRRFTSFSEGARTRLRAARSV
ncbi:hypothetical protein EGR_02705 [Echinococcus granulosus]|uniref:Uncharacterized protein n=1 Tax=Echinococcus granulosus TaxID=6210 RepID=W6UN71_ECHGR|nr:hypothetical protein EGR_02705 [Echinococcus granulosus]EUB62573.1 hypothetical protein EGR_02705 [Echinococcus granulosus]